MQTQLDLVSLEQAKKLKKLGFDWKVHNLINIHPDGKLFYHFVKGVYNNFEVKCDNEDYLIFAAPSIALALKWFRDVKGIFSVVLIETNTNPVFYYGCFYIIKDECMLFEKGYSTPEKAESALLDALIEYVENLEGK